MGRLIDADKLKAHYSWWPEEERKVFDDIVDLQLTIDAEPVKHGQWYDEPNYLGTGRTMFFCSRCGSASYREDPYCWNCGAKMQGGKDDE